MPTKVNLETTDLNNYKYDMSRCIKCKGCYWVEHTYMPGVKFSTAAPATCGTISIPTARSAR